MNNTGFIRTYRNVRDHWLWQDPRKFLRWTDLMMEAAYERTTTRFGNSSVPLERGQIVTSIRRLMHRWGTNSRYVKEFLNLLENEKLIVCESSKAYTIITMVGYDEMQGGGSENYPPETVESEHHRLHQGQRDEPHFKEDNNIIIKNNHPTHNAREDNKKFSEQLKNDETALEDAAAALDCTRQRLLILIDKFTGSVNFKDKEHKDYADFKTHFIDWAGYHVGKNLSNNGNQSKQRPEKGETAQDKYAARRGFDAADHKAEDYSTTF